MATDSEVLLAVNEVLNELETEVKKAGPRATTIWIYTGERDTTRTAIQEALSKTRVKWEQKKTSQSSFDGTIVYHSEGYINFIYKKKKGGGGSGAGAALTKLSESSQCLYAAVAFGLGRHITNSDVNAANAERFKHLFETDEKTESMLNDLPDDWITSCVLGANKLFDQFNNKGPFVFHRGSKTVDDIENQFKRIKKVEGIRMDLNKWSPADIYMIKSNFDIKCLKSEQTILGLNQCMQERLLNHTCMGVSLKKIKGTANLGQMNVFTERKVTKQFDSLSMNYDSIDVYLNLTGGTRIQFRSFGGQSSLTGWQGEVKGANANQGKISLGPVNMILKNHGITPIPVDFARKIQSKSNKPSIMDMVKNGLLTYTNMNAAQWEQLVIEKSNKKLLDSFLYSKSHCVALWRALDSIKDKTKKDQLVEDLYLYASSQSQYSAPYWKLQ